MTVVQLANKSPKASHMQTAVFPCNHDCRRREKEQIPRAARRSSRYMLTTAVWHSLLPLTTWPSGLWLCFLGEVLQWRINGNGTNRTIQVPSLLAPSESVQQQLLQGRNPFHFLPIHPSFCHSALSISFPKSFDLVNKSNEIFVKG